jgi:hypothetical protein
MGVEKVASAKRRAPMMKPNFIPILRQSMAKPWSIGRWGGDEASLGSVCRIKEGAVHPQRTKGPLVQTCAQTYAHFLVVSPNHLPM